VAEQEAYELGANGRLVLDTVPPYRIQAVNPSALEDSHSVTLDRASRAERALGFGDRREIVWFASLRLALALRAKAPYRRRQRAAKVLKALLLVACDPSL
jgi:hypothetical protein